MIISHAHGDHVGGAKLMQDRFGSRLVMGGPDWDAIEKSVNQYPNGMPRRDIVARTARRVTLGDTSVKLVLTPGHTPGTARCSSRSRTTGSNDTVAYSGGTAFNFANDDAALSDTYIASQRKMEKLAAD